MLQLSTNSSNIDIFTQNKYKYEAALKNTGYKAKLVYKCRDETADVHDRNNRTRKILWFPPPYNMTIANKIGKKFFRFLKYKILNRKMIKLSYSTMLNMASLINKSIIKNLEIINVIVLIM